MGKVLFIATNRLDSVPGQRFRFEEYLQALTDNSISWELSNLFTEDDSKAFYAGGNFFRKGVILLKSAFIRIKDCFRLNQFDVIFIQREALIFGPPIFEWFFSRSRAKVIFDFDDSIWLPNVSDANKYFGWLKFPHKIKSIIKRSDLIFAGNQFLANYALNYNKNVVIIPTTIDTDIYVNQNKERFLNPKVCIGWSGSETTIQHMKILEPVFARLKSKYGDKVYFKVIGSKHYKNPELNITAKPWDKNSELEELSEIEIGVMPLPDDEWAKGKCGLKGLQYMAMEIATIMSPVGVNSDIIRSGENGFLATTEDDWFNTLSLLIEDRALSKQIGSNGRKTVEEKYSVHALKETYLKYLS